MLKVHGVEMVAVDSPDAFTPTTTLIRQILGAVSQLEKAMMVSKLRGAEVRKRATGVSSRAGRATPMNSPELVALTRKLHRYPFQ